MGTAHAHVFFGVEFLGPVKCSDFCVSSALRSSLSPLVILTVRSWAMDGRSLISYLFHFPHSDIQSPSFRSLTNHRAEHPHIPLLVAAVPAATQVTGVALTCKMRGQSHFSVRFLYLWLETWIFCQKPSPCEMMVSSVHRRKILEFSFLLLNIPFPFLFLNIGWRVLHISRPSCCWASYARGG